MVCATPTIRGPTQNFT